MRGKITIPLLKAIGFNKMCENVFWGCALTPYERQWILSSRDSYHLSNMALDGITLISGVA